MGCNKDSKAQPPAFQGSSMIYKEYSPQVEAHKLSISERNTLVTKNTGLVKIIARQMQIKCPAEPREDLEQIATIGLIKAVDRFDSKKMVAYGSFASFAVPYMQGAILQYLRDKSNLVKVPKIWQEKHSKAEKLRKRGYCWSAIYEAIGCSELETKEIYAAMANRFAVKLDDLDHFSSASNPEEKPIDENLISQALSELEADLSFLPENDLQIVDLFFFERLPKKMVAQKVNSSPDGVRKKLLQVVLVANSDRQETLNLTA